MSTLDDRLDLARLKRKRLMLSKRISHTLNPITAHRIEIEAEDVLRQIQAIEARLGSLSRTMGAIHGRLARAQGV